MSRDEIQAIVISTLATIAPEVDPGALDPGAELRKQVDLDSMDFLQFVIRLHERLGVEIPESDYPRLRSLQGCVDYLVAQSPKRAR